MAKFRYNLEKVLSHRKIQENLAQKDFQEQLLILNQEIEKLNQMESAWSETFQRMHSVQISGGSNAAELQSNNFFLQGLKIKIERQKQKITHQEKITEEVREFLRQRVTERQIIESHKENKRLEFKKEQMKKEQKEFDDQSTIRFTKQQNEKNSN